MARGDIVLFLDGDCCPAPRWAASHIEALDRSTSVVTVGHRVFLDAAGLTPDRVRELQGDLSGLPRVASSSNYEMVEDRRLPELLHLRSHPAPYNCCHGCNLGVHRQSFLEVGGFDAVFDGSWGYEDIELGHRLWRRGAELHYVEEGMVFHQEGAGDGKQRRIDRTRNYRIACERMPGFEEFRMRQARPYYAQVT